MCVSDQTLDYDGAMFLLGTRPTLFLPERDPKGFNPALPAGFFLDDRWTGLQPAKRQPRRQEERAWHRFHGARPLQWLGWLMGLEPTTTGITILDSTN